MESRNHKLNHASGVDCEINHPVHGWIPFSALPGDVEALSAEILADYAAGKFGVLPPYQKPQAEIDAERRAAAMAELRAIDLASIRSIREYIAAKADAPQILKDREAASVAARAKLV